MLAFRYPTAMGRYGDLNYAWFTKYGFLTGAALFVLGGVGSAVLPSVVGSVPAWERTVLLDMEVFGIVLGFVSVFVFGVALPLTE